MIGLALMVISGLFVFSLGLGRRLSAGSRRTEHLNRVLRATRNVNKLITKERDPSGLLQKACSLLVETRGYSHAWAMLLDESRQCSSCTQSGLARRFEPLRNRLAEGRWAQCVRTAMSGDGVVVVEDPLRQCGDCPLSADYRGCSGFTMRLENGGRIYGVVAVSIPKRFVSNQDERNLFSEVAGDLTLALRSMELEERREQAEVAQRAASRSLDSIVDNSPFPLWVSDSSGTVTRVNRVLCETLAVDRGRIVGKYNVLRDQNLVNRGVMPKVQAVFENHEVVRFSLPWDHADAGDLDLPSGRDLFIDVAMFPIVDADGELTNVVCQWADVTEHKRVEAQLQESSRKTRAVIEASLAAIALLDRDGIVLDCNANYAARLGATREEMVGACVWGRLPEPVEERRRGELARVFETGEPFLNEDEREGIWNRYHISPATWSPEGDVSAVVLEAHDITERKAAEQALRRSEERFRSYVENAPHGVFIVDASGHYVDTNPAATAITGYERDELLTKRVGDLVPEDRREDGVNHFRKVVEKGYADAVLPFVRKNGTRGEWNVTAVRLSDERFLGFVHDVTRRRRMEEQLRQSQKLDAVGQLAGGVAHDFNNMLMGIMGYTDLCRDRVGEEQPVREWLDEIMKVSRRSADVVRQLLAFSRKQTIAPRTVDLNDTIADMLKMLRRLIGEDIDLLWKPGANLRSIRIDPGQVDQALANLCVNARDAIGGVGEICIETANVTLDGDYCATHEEVTPGEFVTVQPR